MSEQVSGEGGANETPLPVRSLPSGFALLPAPLALVETERVA